MPCEPLHKQHSVCSGSRAGQHVLFTCFPGQPATYNTLLMQVYKAMRHGVAEVAVKMVKCVVRAQNSAQQKGTPRCIIMMSASFDYDPRIPRLSQGVHGPCLPSNGDRAFTCMG